MKKLGLFLVLAAMAVSSAFAAGLGSYKVESITGKVQYEAAPGTWKSISVGQELSASTVVNTSLNSSLVINANGTSVTIKATSPIAVDSTSAITTSAGANAIFKKVMFLTSADKTEIENEIKAFKGGINP